MEIWILVAAFIFGFAASRAGLPPLVGYLAAGFALSTVGFSSGEIIERAADLGILLLLFGIGLKLRFRTLTQPYVWGTAATFAVFGVLIPAFALLSLGVFEIGGTFNLDFRSALIVSLALSFSSTVFAVKALERTDEAGSTGGRIAIGVLILQDVLAVGYLVVSEGVWPSPWALLVIPGMILAKPVFRWLLDKSDHGEVMVLLGFTLAVGVGAATFDLLGLKADLGALVVGIALAGHARSSEMADRILGVKDLLLAAFFLSIGLGGFPSLQGVLIAIIAICLLPTRSIALVWLLTRFRLRSRTALHTSLTLSPYSEFGLIVVVAAAAAGAIDSEWIPTMAVAVAGSFVAASVANKMRHRLYDRWFALLRRLERSPIVAEDAVIAFDHARILVFGMGRVGTGAYDELVKRRQGLVVGVEREADVVYNHSRLGREVIRGDALDRDFWERARLHPDVELVVAAMSSHAANLECVRRVREFLPQASIASVALFRDQIADLHEAGVDVARNLYEEAGQALADDAANLLIGLEG